MSEEKSGTYTSPYPADQVSDGLTPTGFTSRQLFHMEETAQRAVAESPKWQLARKANPYSGVKNVQAELETLGFQVVNEVNDLFYEVIPPDGWTRETSSFWTTVKDASGEKRISMFYKGAFYDRDAFLNFES